MIICQYCNKLITWQHKRHTSAHATSKTACYLKIQTSPEGVFLNFHWLREALKKEIDDRAPSGGAGAVMRRAALIDNASGEKNPSGPHPLNV